MTCSRLLCDTEDKMSLDDALTILAAYPKDVFLPRHQLFARKIALEVVSRYADGAIERELGRWPNRHPPG